MTICTCGIDHDLAAEMAASGWSMASRWRVERPDKPSLNRDFNDHHEARMFFLASDAADGEARIYAIDAE